MTDTDPDHRARVAQRYTTAARQITDNSGAGPVSADEVGKIGPSRYTDQLDPDLANVAAGSIGCSNPVAVADLRPGETVLDLGSGAGLDVLLSARRVGSTGKAIGLDMTTEMLELARRNAADCLGGAHTETDYLALLHATGLRQATVKITHEIGNGLHAAIIKAVKPNH